MRLSRFWHPLRRAPRSALALKDPPAGPDVGDDVEARPRLTSPEQVRHDAGTLSMWRGYLSGGLETRRLDCLTLAIYADPDEPETLVFCADPCTVFPKVNSTVARMRGGGVVRARRDPSRPKARGATRDDEAQRSEDGTWFGLVYKVVRDMSETQFAELLHVVGERDVTAATLKRDRATRRIEKTRADRQAAEQEVHQAESDLVQKQLRRAARALPTEAERTVGRALLVEGFSQDVDVFLDTIRGITRNDDSS